MQRRWRLTRTANKPAISLNIEAHQYTGKNPISIEKRYLKSFLCKGLYF